MTGGAAGHGSVVVAAAVVVVCVGGTRGRGREEKEGNTRRLRVMVREWREKNKTKVLAVHEACVSESGWNQG